MVTKQPADTRTNIKKLIAERIEFIRTNLDNVEGQLAKATDWNRCTAMLGNVRGIEDAAQGIGRLMHGLRNMATPKEGR